MPECLRIASSGPHASVLMILRQLKMARVSLYHQASEMQQIWSYRPAGTVVQEVGNKDYFKRMHRCNVFQMTALLSPPEKSKNIRKISWTNETKHFHTCQIIRSARQYEAMHLQHLCHSACAMSDLDSGTCTGGELSAQAAKILLAVTSTCDGRNCENGGDQ
jgi:hypothetical protein